MFFPAVNNINIGWPSVMSTSEIIDHTLLSIAFWKITTAIKSHMTCYNLNLNHFFTNRRNLSSFKIEQS